MSNLRLYLPIKIVATQEIPLSKEDIHYLLNVMKIKNHEEIRAFNRECGEWVCKINIVSKQNVFLMPIENSKKSANPSKIILAFASLKRNNTSLVIQKATELNVREIYPLITERTIARDANIEKLNLVAKEAAEQCGRLDIPKIHNILDINELVKKTTSANLILCDGTQKSEPVLELRNKLDYQKDSVVLIGPEGGLSQNERNHLSSLANCFCTNLGGLTLRAETASIAALFAIQALYNLNNYHE
jgi:16S rRNA (uracil1498-N3)-methyltransferase